MYTEFQNIIDAAAARPNKRTIVIAAAADDKMIHVAQAVTDIDLCKVILVGDAEEIGRLAQDADFDLNRVRVVDEKDPAQLGLTAVKLVSSG